MKTLRSISLLASSAGKLLNARWALFSAEFKLERLRLVRSLVFLLLGAVFLGVGLLTAATLMVFIVTEENRVAVLGIMALFLFCSASLSLGFGLHYVFWGRNLFKETTEALKDDQECLKSHFKK
jgi:uncharacterized membrane protein YqjE